jgi:hypothetical protein
MPSIREEYDVYVKAIRDAPATYFPALVALVVEESIHRNVWADGTVGLRRFIDKLIKRFG